MSVSHQNKSKPQDAESTASTAQEADLSGLREILNLTPVRKMEFSKKDVWCFWGQKALFDGGRLLYVGASCEPSSTNLAIFDLNTQESFPVESEDQEKMVSCFFPLARMSVPPNRLFCLTLEGLKPMRLIFMGSAYKLEYVKDAFECKYDLGGWERSDLQDLGWSNNYVPPAFDRSGRYAMCLAKPSIKLNSFVWDSLTGTKCTISEGTESSPHYRGVFFINSRDWIFVESRSKALVVKHVDIEQNQITTLNNLDLKLEAVKKIKDIQLTYSTQGILLVFWMDDDRLKLFHFSTNLVCHEIPIDISNVYSFRLYQCFFVANTRQGCFVFFPFKENSNERLLPVDFAPLDTGGSGLLVDVIPFNNEKNLAAIHASRMGIFQVSDEFKKIDTPLVNLLHHVGLFHDVGRITESYHDEFEYPFVAARMIIAVDILNLQKELQVADDKAIHSPKNFLEKLKQMDISHSTRMTAIEVLAREVFPDTIPAAIKTLIEKIAVTCQRVDTILQDEANFEAKQAAQLKKR